MVKGGIGIRTAGSAVSPLCEPSCASIRQSPQSSAARCISHERRHCATLTISDRRHCPFHLGGGRVLAGSTAIITVEWRVVRLHVERRKPTRLHDPHGRAGCAPDSLRRCCAVGIPSAAGGFGCNFRHDGLAWAYDGLKRRHHSYDACDAQSRVLWHLHCT